MIVRLLPLFLAVICLNSVVSAENLLKNNDINHKNKSIENDEKSSNRLDRKSGRTATLLEISRNGGIENNLSVDGTMRKGSSRTSSADLEPREEDLIEAADFGIQAMNELYLIKEPKLYEMGLYLSPNNPARYVAAFNDQTEEAKQLAQYGYAALEAATKFRAKFPDMLRQASSMTRNSDRSPLKQQCPKKGIPQCTPASLRYRTTDGSCNNLRELWWGSSMSPMQRFLPAFYDDDIQSVRRSVTGADLPSARQISDHVHEDRDAPLVSVTQMLMQWGQFIDHDITATGQSTAFNGSVPQCCLDNSRGVQPPEFLHPECLPIVVPKRDSRLGDLGVRCMEFVRSGPIPREDCVLGTREQLSQVTSFIDASTVYSSSARQSDNLRIFRNGLMQYGKLQSRRPLLPREEESDLCRRGSLSTNCFKAGDVRLSEQPALISLHVVFLRLHNRLATQMSAKNPHWGDEKIFQETRKIVGAIVQHITYREFLPIVLGQDVLKIFDIELLPKGYYEGYDESVNPSIANEFSAAAFRFGHSLVQPSFVRFDNNHRPLFNNVSIHEEFMHPANLESAGSVDRLLLGLVNQPAQKRDEFISEELTNHLFQTPGFPFGMDLASINIQRGRDHGIPPYIEYRLACGLNPVRSWTDLERVMTPNTVRKFRELYAAVEDLDLFSAGLAEKPVPGGLVGPTFACIIAQQFRNLRKGDRFWYENAFLENGFTPDQLEQIRRVTLAQVLCRTMENIDSIQPFVMLTADNMRNQRVPCSDSVLDPINLGPWVERPRRRSLDEKEENKDTESRAAPTKKTTPATRLPPQRQKPMKTRISQHNRIAVRRPLGPNENITIVVSNTAINSPIFLTDSIYGSNVQINRYPASTGSEGSSYKPPQNNPYIPHNFQDPNNPNPPNYGLSPKPMNNYIPNNEFFAYAAPSAPSIPLEQSTNYGASSSSNNNQNNQNQQYSYFSTPRPSSTQRPYQQRPTARPTVSTIITTTRRSYPDYDFNPNYSPQSNTGGVSYGTQTSIQNPYASNFEPNSSDRDENNPNSSYGNNNNARPTKKPKLPPYQQGMSNRRYPETKPQTRPAPNSKRPTQNYQISTGSTKQTTARPQSIYNFVGSSSSFNPIPKPIQDAKEEPNYIHTHTTISDVQYVTADEQQKQRPVIKTETELPKPLSWLENRASASSAVKSSTKENDDQEADARVAMEELKLTTIAHDEVVEKQTTLKDGDSVGVTNDDSAETPEIEAVVVEEEEEEEEEDVSWNSNVSDELPRPIQVRRGS